MMKQYAHDGLSRCRLFVRIMTRDITRVIMVFLVFAGPVLLVPFPVAAQDLQALLNRVERLERDIRTLNTQIARGQGAVTTTSEDSGSAVGSAASNTPLAASGVAWIDARITALENDVRDATGAMESLDHRLFEMSGKLDKLISDVDFRLLSLERGGGTGLVGQAGVDGITGNEGTTQVTGPVNQVAPVTQVSQASEGVLGTITEAELEQISSSSAVDQQQVSSASVEPSDPQAPVSQDPVSQEQEAVAGVAAPVASGLDEALSPQDQYTQAFGLLRQAKYDDAAIALQAFVNQHPEDSLAPNARYWLGETFYVRAEFVRAAEVFFEGYRVAPNGPKAPDTLLKLGMSLGNLGKNAEACAAFTKLSGEFADMSASVRNALDRESLRNGCS